MSAILTTCLVWNWYAGMTNGAAREVDDCLLRDLGDPRFAVRQAATRAIARDREEHRPALERATRSTDPEVRRRAELILTGVYP